VTFETHLGSETECHRVMRLSLPFPIGGNHLERFIVNAMVGVIRAAVPSKCVL
jgi:hypothetical protein